MKSKNNILLPRSYLSWSAMSTWKRSKTQFIEHYIYGKENTFTSNAIEFGKIFAEHLENGKKHDNPITDLILKTVPKLPNSEYELNAVLKTKDGDIPLKGKLDRYHAKKHDFQEFKTGKRKWTRNMAQSHGQMKFYALMIWLKYGRIPNNMDLVWVETEDDEDGIVPTGRIEVFPVSLSLTDIMDFGNEVIKVAKEISDFYKEEIEKTL